MFKKFTEAKYQGKNVQIMTGWDKVTGYFMIIEDLEFDPDFRDDELYQNTHLLYSNLDDPQLRLPCFDYRYFIGVLQKMGIEVENPESLWQDESQERG